MKKYKYFISFFIAFTAEALSVQEPPLNQGSQVCIISLLNKEDRQLLTHYQDTLILTRAMDAFEPPAALKKVEASNIEITEDLEGELYRREYDKEELPLAFYEVSFPVNGQTLGFLLIIDKQDFIHVSNTGILETLKNIFSEIPVRALNQVDEIELKYDSIDFMQTIEYQLFKPLQGEATAHSSQNHIIKIFPRNNGSYLNRTLTADTIRHELGHIIIHRRNGTYTPDQKWRDAIKADDTSVSDYGDTSVDEDFAEAMNLYLKTNGGIYYPNVARRYAHRFNILDEILGVRLVERRRISEINHLFEIQINDLLKKFGLPTHTLEASNEDDMILERIGELNGLENFSNIRLTKLLRDFWRNNPQHIAISAILADKIHTLQRERSLGPDSLEMRLTRIILENTFWAEGDHIPEFIANTVYSLDTLSVSEMQHHLHTLERVRTFYMHKRLDAFREALQQGTIDRYIYEDMRFNRNQVMTFEQVLEEIEQ